MNDDYYTILGIDHDASEDAIKKAYRKLAKECHPDRHPDNEESEERFKNLQEAYAVLSDPDKRKSYDLYGHAGTKNSSRPSSAVWDDVNDIFHHFVFNWHQNHETFRQKQNIPSDIRLTVSLSLADAIRGKTVKFKINRQIECDTCKGMQAIKTDNICRSCNGTGTNNDPKFRLIVGGQRCPQCMGSGKESVTCSECKGQGFQWDNVSVKFSIPAGVSPLQVFRLKGQGNQVYRNSKKYKGDIFVHVDCDTEQDGVTYYKGQISTSVNVPIDKILAEDTVQVDILGIAFADIILEIPHSTNYHSHIKVNNKKIPVKIKVFPCLPQKKIDNESAHKLVKLYRETFGESESVIQPIAD